MNAELTRIISELSLLEKDFLRLENEISEKSRAMEELKSELKRLGLILGDPIIPIT